MSFRFRAKRDTESPRKPIVYYGNEEKTGQRIPIRIKRMLADEEKEEAVHVPFDRILDWGNTRTLPYRRRKFEWKPPLHFGQIKLFISELEFLTKYGDRSRYVIYAGSADGKHIPYLAHLFPEHHFILWDPAPMYHGYLAMRNIEFHQGLFTEDVARAYAQSHPEALFISDIRSVPDGVDYSQMTPELDIELEEDVKRDMDFQRCWCEIMEPSAAMLKFRLPYTPGVSEYLDGEIHFQAFASETSSETRLVIDKTRFPYGHPREYNHEEYENYLYRFNRCTRIQSDTCDADATIAPLFGDVPMSYDAHTFIQVVREYLAKHDHTNNRPGEIIYNVLQYLNTTFSRKYAQKKKIHEEHMKQNIERASPD
jgi:hypothetical protein